MVGHVDSSVDQEMKKKMEKIAKNERILFLQKDALFIFLLLSKKSGLSFYDFSFFRRK